MVTALGSFVDGTVAETLAARLAAGDASYLVEGELAHSLGRTRQPAALGALRAAIDRPSWNETIRVGVFDGLAALQDPRAIELVAPGLARHQDILVRCAAARCLTSFYSAPEQAMRALEPWLGDSAFRLQLTLAAHLEQLADHRALKALQRLVAHTANGRVRRRGREAVRRLSELLGAGRATHDLRTELDDLRQSHRDLRDRMDRHLQRSAAPDEG